MRLPGKAQADAEGEEHVTTQRDVDPGAAARHRRHPRYRTRCTYLARVQPDPAAHHDGASGRHTSGRRRGRWRRTSFAPRADHGQTTQDGAQTQRAETLGQSRCVGEEYFRINHMKPVMIMHPFKPEFEGTDLNEIQHVDGNHIFVYFVDFVSPQGEEVDYICRHWHISTRSARSQANKTSRTCSSNSPCPVSTRFPHPGVEPRLREMG